MIDSIPNLWPAEFKIDVQTPYTILNVQANLLGKVTRGIDLIQKGRGVDDDLDSGLRLDLPANAFR